LTQRIHTCDDNAGVYRWLKPRGRSSVVAIDKPSHLDASLLPRRPFDDALRLLPGVRHRRITRPSGFIKIIAIDLAVVFWFLPGCQGTLTRGKGCRLSETFSRLAHPLPSKTGFFGETFQGRDTDALGGFGGEARDNVLERTGLFLERRDGQRVFFRCQLWRSATARLIRYTGFTLLFPLRDPCGDGVSIHLRDLGNVIDDHPLDTQYKTMGAGAR
jgi:hypothetical protein